MDRGQVAEMWFRSLAEDLLEHGNCRGCRRNAAQGLAELDLLHDALARLGVDDPRRTEHPADGDPDHAPGDG